MNEIGLQPNRPYAKSARIVGDVMGKYHPHGDSAIYDTLVRHGAGLLPALPARRRPGQLRLGRRRPGRRHAVHRGAPGADRARDAARPRRRHRRLRAQLRRLAAEPLVLPARFPNLLVNGSSGIAVGMATNIPPHNLRETIAATIAYIDDPDIDVDGPDAAHEGPGLPDRRRDPRASAASATPTRPAAAACACARAPTSSRLGHGKEAIIVTELPFHGQEGRRRRRDPQDRRARQRQEAHRDLRPARRDRPQRHAARDRAQARREPEGRAQQALQAHADADDVRREHGRARRQRAAHAAAALGDPQLRPAPARGHRPPLQARAARARALASIASRAC